MPRESNWEVNKLAQVALGVKMSEELTHKLIVIGNKNNPSIYERRIRLEVVSTYANVAGDWRIKIKEYLEDPNKHVPYRVKAQSQNFVIMEGELYGKGLDGLLLRCLSFLNNMKVMKQVHEGVYGAHHVRIKIRWLIRKHDHLWQTILSDYIKGCQQCQKYGSIQRIPVVELHSIVKSWSLKGWAIDLIGKIYRASSKGQNFILVVIDYFTKWVEAIPLKKAEQKDVI